MNIIPITNFYGTYKELVAVCWVLYIDQRSHHWFSPHCSSVHEAVFSFLASTLKFTATAQRFTMSTVYSYSPKCQLQVSEITLFIELTSSTAQGGGGSFKNRKPIGEIGCCESRMAERIH